MQLNAFQAGKETRALNNRWCWLDLFLIIITKIIMDRYWFEIAKEQTCWLGFFIRQFFTLLFLSGISFIFSEGKLQKDFTVFPINALKRP